ncbi:MAG: hypothetical protein ACK6CT_04840 [Planctomycetia bacterium]
MPPADRRQFLARTTATAAAAGLGFPFAGLAAGDEAPDAPDDGSAKHPPVDYSALFAEARERMQREHKPGVVIVIPPDPDAAAALESELTATLMPERTVNADAWARVRLFCRAVFIALPAAEVSRRFPKAAADALCLVLDAAGNVVESVAIPDRREAPDANPLIGGQRPAIQPGSLGAAFIADMQTRLDGPDGRRLAADAQAQRAALADGGREVDRLVADLTALDASDEEHDLAADALLSQVAGATAIILEHHNTADAAQAYRFSRIFLAACGGIRQGAHSPCLPYGVECAEIAVAEKKDPCPRCGLSRPGPQARRFLRVLGSPEADAVCPPRPGK